MTGRAGPPCDTGEVTPHLPLLVFDGDCGFCTTTARFAVRRLRPHPEAYAVEAWQSLDLPALGLTEAACTEAVQWVARDGRVYAAERAVAHTLLASRWWARPVGAAMLAPGVRQAAGAAYRWVAARRSRLPGGTPACALPTP